ncbi:MAG: 2-C-methyl-D-erythritol 4-phosphate cytidylyltransferase [Gammaproteobacteria bacterium]|nr:2-C-methyl-D-erythritol 4-phosphate cytidylyltransferase [Gammaproteobacteria bacterium]
MRAEVPVWAVIPAAGSGSRMQQARPKQYLEFHGKTIIEHCLDRLLSHAEIDGAVIVLQPGDHFWEDLGYLSNKPVFITDGGAERQHSVYSGLTTLQYRCGNDAIALVHDAVRPLVSHDDLDRVIATARAHTAGAILAIPLNDTLKRQTDDMQIADTIARQGLWRALTPQVFHLQVLLNALKRVNDEGIAVTDDAQAVELAGYSPALVAGNADNLKITTPGDMALAELIWLNQRNQQDDK